MHKLWNGKAPGTDNVPAELLAESSSEGAAFIHKPCNKIWGNKEWQKGQCFSIPIKGDTRDCANNRTISLISHASKIMLHIMAEKIRSEKI